MDGGVGRPTRWLKRIKRVIQIRRRGFNFGALPLGVDSGSASSGIKLGWGSFMRREGSAGEAPGQPWRRHHGGDFLIGGPHPSARDTPMLAGRKLENRTPDPAPRWMVAPHGERIPGRAPPMKSPGNVPGQPRAFTPSSNGIVVRPWETLTQLDEGIAGGQGTFGEDFFREIGEVWQHQWNRSFSGSVA